MALLGSPLRVLFWISQSPTGPPLLVAVRDSNGVWGTLTLYLVANQLEGMKE